MTSVSKGNTSTKLYGTLTEIFRELVKPSGTQRDVTR